MNENAMPPVPSRSAEDLLPIPLRRFVPLLVVIALTLGLVGFFSGLGEPKPTRQLSAVAVRNHEKVPLAPSYSQLTTSRQQLIASSSLNDLKYDRPGLLDPVTRTNDMKLAAIEDRSRNRAYDGAPPTIPHPIDSRSVASCLACHAEGIKIGERVASKISHGHLTNCTQCHVEQSPAALALEPVKIPENTFVGVYRAGPGSRASTGAPPTIPHHTWMRENCMSCHGLVTRAGIRTTHPWLTNCMQCHAPAAALDQVQFVRGQR